MESEHQNLEVSVKQLTTLLNKSTLHENELSVIQNEKITIEDDGIMEAIRETPNSRHNYNKKFDFNIKKDLKDKMKSYYKRNNEEVFKKWKRFVIIQ